MDRFVYYSKSAAGAMPGKGANEQLASTTPSDRYAKLASMPGWRKVLSQFHVEEFEFDGCTFRTAEHAWHYTKLKTIGQSDKADEFTTDKGRDIGMRSPAYAKRAGGKRGIHAMSKEEILTWDALKREKIDDMLYAKFSSCALAREVLEATGNAEVLHYERGPKFVDLLSRVRDRLRRD